MILIVQNSKTRFDGQIISPFKLTKLKAAKIREASRGVRADRDIFEVTQECRRPRQASGHKGRKLCHSKQP